MVVGMANTSNQKETFTLVCSKEIAIKLFARWNDGVKKSVLMDHLIVFGQEPCINVVCSGLKTFRIRNMIRKEEWTGL